MSESRSTLNNPYFILVHILPASTPKMAAMRNVMWLARPVKQLARPFSISTRFRSNDRMPKEVEDHRKHQKEKPLGPHMTNTTSTIANEMPSLGADKAPPEMLTSVDPDFAPKDSSPENTERMTGGTQKSKPDQGPNDELKVGEMEGAKFKVEPLRRTGEDGNTMRARLLCPFLYCVVNLPFADIFHT